LRLAKVYIELFPHGISVTSGECQIYVCNVGTDVAFVVEVGGPSREVLLLLLYYISFSIKSNLLLPLMRTLWGLIYTADVSLINKSNPSPYQKSDHCRTLNAVAPDC
jgi:hypothetical protein